RLDEERAGAAQRRVPVEVGLVGQDQLGPLARWLTRPGFRLGGRRWLARLGLVFRASAGGEGRGAHQRRNEPEVAPGRNAHEGALQTPSAAAWGRGLSQARPQAAEILPAPPAAVNGCRRRRRLGAG